MIRCGLLAAVLFVVGACAGTTTPTTTTAVIETTTTSTSTTTTVPPTTTTTMPPTTTTTIDADAGRAVLWSVLVTVGANMDLVAASDSAEGLAVFVEQSELILETISQVEEGPMGWGQCQLAVDEYRTSIILLVEGAKLWFEAKPISDTEMLNDGTELVERAADGLNNARLLADVLCPTSS